ncbi:MAG: BolA family protein [Pseudomonadota bacterium]
MKDRMEAKLTAEFQPEHLEIIDESEAHRGHGGYREGGETHFRVRMRASVLKGKTRVAQQRAVYACVSQELEERVHALALEISA